MAAGNLPKEVTAWILQLASVLHRRVAWRLLPLLAGALHEGGRDGAEILEAVADRAAIEQDFHDLKEVHGPVSSKCEITGPTSRRITSRCGGTR